MKTTPFSIPRERNEFDVEEARPTLISWILMAVTRWLNDVVLGKNVRGLPPQCHVYPREIAGLIKGLLTISGPRKNGLFFHFFLGSRISGQVVIFHQPGFHWNNKISLPKSYLLGAQVVWGRYNLTRLIDWKKIYIQKSRYFLVYDILNIFFPSMACYLFFVQLRLVITEAPRFSDILAA